jgi:hypothetical protein
MSLMFSVLDYLTPSIFCAIQWSNILSFNHKKIEKKKEKEKEKESDEAD